MQSGHSPLNSSPDPNACCGPMSSHAFQADRADQAVCCPTCGMYFQDDGFSTDTSSDDGTEMMSDDQIDPSEAYLQYAFARKRWRRDPTSFLDGIASTAKGVGVLARDSSRVRTLLFSHQMHLLEARVLAVERKEESKDLSETPKTRMARL